MEASRCHRRVHQRRNGHRKDCDSSQSRQEGRFGVPRMGTHNGAGRQGQHMVHRKPSGRIGIRPPGIRPLLHHTRPSQPEGEGVPYREIQGDCRHTRSRFRAARLHPLRRCDTRPRSVGQVRTHHERRVCQGRLLLLQRLRGCIQAAERHRHNQGDRPFEDKGVGAVPL